MTLEAIITRTEPPISFMEEGRLDRHESRALAWYRHNKRVEPTLEQVRMMSGYWRMVEEFQKTPVRC